MKMSVPKFVVVALILAAVSPVIFAAATSKGGKPEDQDNPPLAAVSFVFADDFTPTTVNFEVSVKPNNGPGEAEKPRVTASFSGTSITEDKMVLDISIDQLLGVKDIKVTSSSMPEIRFLALVVNSNVFVEEKTRFKATCTDDDGADGIPCKAYGAKITPVFVCPQAMTALLQKEEVITKVPLAESYQEGKAPVYDITDDMAQASLVIAGGVAEGTRLAVKYQQTVNARTLSKGIEKFTSFLKTIGPVLESFGGITSILTNFLTPNPFDALAGYLEEQFDIVQQQLTDIGNDIKNLELVVEGQSQKLAMSTALRLIRHELRSYNRMTTALSQSNVCDTKALLQEIEVESFMEETLYKDLRNNLEDLLDVEFGGVLEASTGLLKPYMRAYCVSHPSRSKKFLQHIQMYAYGGTAALFAYENLKCLKSGKQTCPYQQTDRDEWTKKLYKFTSAAKIYETYFNNPAKAMALYLKDDLNNLIKEEVEKVQDPSPTSDNPFPGLLDKVYDLIIRKLKDTHDWLYTCIYNPRMNANKMLIFEVAETDAEKFGTSFIPWAMFRVAKVRTRHQIERPSGYQKTDFTAESNAANIREVRERNGGEDCYFQKISGEGRFVIRPWRLEGLPPTGEARDEVLWFIYNPMNFKMHTSIRKVIGSLVPIDVYYGQNWALEDVDLPNFVMGCWKASAFYGWPRDYECRAPDPNNPNRERSSQERYAVIIGE